MDTKIFNQWRIPSLYRSLGHAVIALWKKQSGNSGKWLIIITIYELGNILKFWNSQRYTQKKWWVVLKITRTAHKNVHMGLHTCCMKVYGQTFQQFLDVNMGGFKEQSFQKTFSSMIPSPILTLKMEEWKSSQINFHLYQSSPSIWCYIQSCTYPTPAFYSL